MTDLAVRDGGPGSGLKLTPWLGLVLGLLAGLTTWGAVQGVHPVFDVPKDAEAPSIGMAPEVYVKNRRARETVARRHAMLYLGGLAAAVALALGAGESVLRRRIWPPLAAVPIAALGGVLGGYFGSRVHEDIYERIGQPEILHTVMAQCATLIPLGFAVGVGLALTAPSWAGGIKTAVAGLAAGAIAAVAYPIAVAFLIPDASTDALLPFQLGSRGLWFGLAGGLLGLIVPIAGRTRPALAAPPTSPS